jgi:hypothetical protein
MEEHDYPLLETIVDLFSEKDAVQFEGSVKIGKYNYLARVYKLESGEIEINLFLT